MAKYSKGAKKGVESAMKRMEKGKLRSGGSGKKVSNPKQAIAIGLSEARKKGAKVPKKAAPKKTAPKKAAPKKIAKKAAPKKVAKKAAPKKTAPKKVAAKKVAKKAAPKKVAKKAAPKKAAPKKVAPKKAAPKKAAVKKTAPKKIAPKKAAPKRQPPKKVAVKSSPTSSSKRAGIRVSSPAKTVIPENVTTEQQPVEETNNISLPEETVINANDNVVNKTDESVLEE